jgi:DNA repair exonuclease SbcCD ATPase subunit
MKKDITPITDALQFVRKLKPVQYKWKENSHGRTHTGFIAQDVLECNPLNLKDNWAGYIDTGNGLGLRYGEFISINTKAIKELDEKLSKLQKSSVIIHEDGETKSDVNYHTDTSELYERIESLEQQIEEMSDTIGENTIQNVIEIQSDDDRTELTEELERLSRKNDKLEETLNNNDAVIQELVRKINVLENRLKQKQDEETEEESEGGINMVEMLQNRNYEMEQRMNKLEKTHKKLTSNLNKILKQLKNDTN